MSPVSRRKVSKSKSVKRFNRQTARTHSKNLKSGPMRGGIRS